MRRNPRESNFSLLQISIAIEPLEKLLCRIALSCTQQARAIQFPKLGPTKTSLTFQVPIKRRLCPLILIGPIRR
jgi:hypothetical protein